MNAEEKIRKALADKNWVIADYYWDRVQYYPEGREGGFQVDVCIESSDRDIVDKYFEAWEKVEEEIIKQGIIAECGVGFIAAYNLKDVMSIISLIPDRLTIEI